MSFETSTDLEALLQRVRHFVDGRVIPLEKDFLSDGPEAFAPKLRSLRDEVKDAGLWAPHLSTALGGMGLSLPDFARVAEELGRSLIAHPAFLCQAPEVGNMEVLIEHGTAEQKTRYLEPLLDGSKHSCFAMTEPEHAGSNPTLMSTTAKLDGDEWVINGHKWFTTAADGAAFAIVMAVTDPDAPLHERASMLLVPCDAQGFSLERNIAVMGEAGGGFSSHGEVRLAEVRVPRNALLGQRGKGFAIAQERLGPGRIHHCMRWIGICERALELLCRRATRREIGGDRVLADMQAVQTWIAELRAEIDAARLLVLQTAARIDAVGASSARREISQIKYFVARVLQRSLDCAIQVHGAEGISDDLPLAWWYRHERGARIYDGADEVHKARVAKLVLAPYRN